MKLAIVFALLSVTGAAHAADPAKYVSAQLVAETQAPKPGSTILVGFSMIPQPGWHVYWSNPGDSGIAPSVRWSLPTGLSAGSLQHPPPQLLLADGLSSFVHTGPQMLLARIRVARSVAVGSPIPVQAELNWAACTETKCVPLHETFSLNLVAGNGTPGPSALSLSEAQSRIPRSGFHGTFSTRGTQVRLAIPENLRLDPRTTRFFPDENGFFHTSAAHAAREKGALAITSLAGASAIPKSLSGVVADGASAYRIMFTRVKAQPESSKPETSATQVAEVVRAEPMHGATPSTPEVARPRQMTPRPESSGAAWLWVLGVAAAVALTAATLVLRRN